jgi:toxin HigB-1
MGSNPFGRAQVKPTFATFGGAISIRFTTPFLLIVDEADHLTPEQPRVPRDVGCSCNATRYTRFVIQAFADKDTEKLFNGRRVKKYSPELSDRALQKLLMLNAANQVSDLRMPPGNRLEALVGDRKGQYSIRINDQYRICFVWTAAGPRDVQIVDYH